MQGVLQSGYLSVLEAKTKDDLFNELVRFSNQLGFEFVSAMAVVDHYPGEPEFVTIDNAPPDFLEIACDFSLGKSDPVMQHCRQRGVPIIWDQHTYVRVDQGEKWELQAQFGYRYGVAWAMHMPGGRHFVLGVDRDQALPAVPSELANMAAKLQLFAVHAQEAVMSILVPSIVAFDFPSLTPRELETLRWTMEGKTAWEVGRILGIAEETVVRHAHNAARKLGCSGKHHAVIKALRLGLIR